jgi:excisionase family DNA binding protein
VEKREILPARLLTVQQAAEYLSTTVPAVRHLYYSRQLSVVKIGKRFNFDMRDLDAFIERSKHTA